jgi:hypothetical protein
MAHMQMMVYQKGALYSADCSKCGATMFTHEWYHGDHNERRDAMEAGTLCCDDCGAPVDKETFAQHRKSYAGLYSAPGYMDRTDVHYNANVRKLKRELRDAYGDE